MIAPSSARSAKFRPDIEGLRAVAVLLVVTYHARLLHVGGGFIGVDVFFVLSGFLITEILVVQLERTNRIAYREFYARRVLRLLPAASLMLLVVIVTATIVYSPLERIDISLSAVATALYSSNMFFLAGATNYFSAGAESNPLLHTWSLAVEEQFYFVWPFLVFVGWRLTRSRERFCIVLAVFAVASLLGEAWLTTKNQPWAFYAMPARAWEFGLGGLAALAVVRRTLASRIPVIAGWIGFALVIASAMLIDNETSFPGLAAFAPAAGTALLLYAGRFTSPLGPGRLLELPPLQWLGRHSYSWYLWHWPVLVVTAEFVPHSTWIGRTSFMIAALVAAAATTALVENPIRFNKSLRATPWRVIIGGSCLSVAVAAVAYGIHRDAVAHGGAYAHAAHDPSALTERNCVTDYTATIPRECVFGDTTSLTQVVLFGDSHAGQWFPAIDSMARLHHWRLVTLIKSSCPVADEPMYNYRLNRAYTECSAWRQNAIARIHSIHPSLLVIGQFARDQILVRPDHSQAPLTPADWETGMRESLRRLQAADMVTVVMRDSPMIGRPVPYCLSDTDHRDRPHDTCGAPRKTAVDSVYFQADVRASSELGHVSLLDLTDDICGPVVCDPIHDDVVVYRDQNHLSTAFVTLLSGAFDRRLSALLTARENGSSRQ